MIYTTDEIIGKTKVPKLKAEVFWPVLAIWQSNFTDLFFSGDVKQIKQYLEGVKYSSIQILSKKHFKLKGEQISFDNEEKMKSLATNNDILFVNSNWVSYDTYFKAMIEIQKRRYEKDNHGALKKPFIVDVPNVYIKELKNKGLNLFD